MTHLKIKNLNVSIDQKPIIRNFSAEIRARQIVTIMGPSGSGKSTILHAIGGHLPPKTQSNGGIWLNGKDITKLPSEARKVGILFQDALLFPHLSVGQNLGFGLKSNTKDRREHIEAALDEARLSGFFDRDPASLSGGQAARAALMRTMLAEPSALLLDEPFSKLDTKLRGDVREFVFQTVSTRQIPCLLVSHDHEDALATKGEIIEINVSS